MKGLGEKGEGGRGNVERGGFEGEGKETTRTPRATQKKEGPVE